MDKAEIVRGMNFGIIHRLAILQMADLDLQNFLLFVFLGFRLVQSHALLHRTITLVETLVEDDGLFVGVDLLGGVRRREHGAEVVNEACDRVHVHNVVYEVVV